MVVISYSSAKDHRSRLLVYAFVYTGVHRFVGDMAWSSLRSGVMTKWRFFCIVV